LKNSYKGRGRIKNPVLLKKIQVFIPAISYLSTRQFTRVFTKSYGMSPKEYLIKLRINHACRIMEDSRLTLSEVALESGFSDISFFQDSRIN
jgi:transcriptional regulator GlxA family with amidase domain